MEAKEARRSSEADATLPLPPPLPLPPLPAPEEEEEEEGPTEEEEDEWRCIIEEYLLKEGGLTGLLTPPPTALEVDVMSSAC